MITKRDVKKYNAMEIKVKLTWMTRKYNAVILASQEDGFSIKHYPKCKAEVTYLLRDFGSVNGIEWAKKTYYDPEYCFIRIYPEGCVEILEDVIKHGRIANHNHGTSPRCPFS